MTIINGFYSKIMNNKNNPAAIYYTVVSFLAISLCAILITTLEWPALAEIPLAAAIFIHITALSKMLYKFWREYKERFSDELTTNIKAVLFKLDTQEEEVNI